MKWNKIGIICNHESFNLPWYKKNTMVPVPYLVDDTRLRIFLTMCDEQNVGRIGYVDVNPLNPSEIIGYSSNPVLDIGQDGTFDDSGVLPSSIYKRKDKIYMFYSAYQKQVKVPYSILSGLAVSDLSVNRFSRVQSVPVLERTNEEMFIRSAVYCMDDNNKFKMYYSSGSNWTRNKVKEVPAYDIKCLESSDFFNWNSLEPQSCIKLQGDEYGLTTPNVYKEDGIYKMIYAIRSVSKGYRIGYAESDNGIEWTRMDEKMHIDVSSTGWDSEMICFANMFTYKEKTYLFYCGNHYGMGGMGYAELIK